MAVSALHFTALDLAADVSYALHAQISDNGWTDQTVIDLAQQLSKAPKGEIEIRPLPRSD